jgi:asparagine synthase (glutamine-hydrolysing)
VRAAAEAIRHRGPDHGAVGQWGRCTLGNRRLRVIDLATGDQPVANEDGSVVAVFNGEVYNFRELRHRLEQQGHRLAGTGDTPTLPHLYEQHGDRFVDHLDGMFALAVWDVRRERLLLARDRFGKKPLLWTQLPDGSVAFASELKALLAFPGLRREVSLERLDAYLSLGYVPGAETALEGVHRLEPGHLLVAERGVVRTEQYWSLEATPGVPRSDEEWVEAVRDGVRNAVRKRLVSDVPLGALLSGGIDSSVVVATMAQASSEPVRTFSVGFEDQRYDERRYARLIAERYGTIH